MRAGSNPNGNYSIVPDLGDFGSVLKDSYRYVYPDAGGRGINMLAFSELSDLYRRYAENCGVVAGVIRSAGSDPIKGVTVSHTGYGSISVSGPTLLLDKYLGRCLGRDFDDPDEDEPDEDEV